jgi:hypothetical protein
LGAIGPNIPRSLLLDPDAGFTYVV